MKFQCALMGANFRSGETREPLKSLAAEEDVVLELVRDKDNKYDANAITLHHGGYDLGFVAKETAAELAPLMDDGVEFTATIHSWLGTLKPHVIIEQV